jgi:cystathionine beta-synthase
VRHEGLYVGGSGGAAVAGALKYAKMLDDQGAKKENILILLPDSAQKYLSKIFNDDWMRENGFLGDEDSLGTVRDLLKPGHALVTASSTAKVREVIEKLKTTGISQVPIVDGRKLVGIVAEVDLLRHLVSGSGTLDSAVGPLVEGDYATVTQDTKIELLQGVLTDAKVAIVLEAEQVIGIISKIDLIEFLAKRTQPAG